MSNSTTTPTAHAPSEESIINGKSIPQPMLAGAIFGVIFGIFCLILHVCLVRYLVKARAKHIPKVRKVKAKKGKKDKKLKKSKKSDDTSTGASTGSSIAM
ncbi:uncharacterized protein CELE_F54H12.10 [Caenorhabditis elegans]|uniref:Uncharacterized protein n=1 Tax=Caenorhabditis elegans TaxID=6239 RepID=A0A5S9MRZ2_CAEEL|nr:Uncharacterized protein CELE_F54H12.10 [Caenorhabditis elegans]CAA0059182.1 Uncharacterized protein CELE_F54H12.10 [Caenorhabditis elegans]